nr:DUF4040 domain-containing protein [Burkholderiaceae bacterium]
MVKLGVYLLARLDPAFGHEGWWQAVLAGIGSVTAAWAMVLALRERDLKRILAWSTVAALGTLVMLIGLRGDGATVAVGAFILAHALYKAPLFFVAGNVDHGTGTRVIDRLGNLRGAMPFTAIAALLAGLSMAGLPTSFGYVAKDVITVAKGELEGLAWISYANLFVSGVAVAVAGVAAVRVFWRHPGQSETCDAHEGGAALVLPPIVIALTGIVLGLLPDLASGLLREAARAMTPGIGGPDVSLNLEIGPVLGTVAATLVIGAAVFWFWDGLHALLERADPVFRRFGPDVLYQRSLDWLVRLAALSTRTVQHGSLPGYALLMTGAVTAVLIALLAAVWPQLPWPAAQWPTPAIAGAALLLAAGALAACRIRDRLVLLLASGLVGYGSAALFLFTGAPDLAFTQFSVETVFVVVAATVLLKLKRLGRDQGIEEPRLRIGAAVVAIAFGGTLTLLLLAATGGVFDTALPQFFGERSVPEAYGRNVVNVIIVDFRALDTLGEIAVVAFSLLAALPLLAALRRARGGRTAR